MIAVVQTPCDKIVSGDANGDCKFDVEDLDVLIQYYNGDVGSLRYEEIHKMMMDMDMNSKMNTIAIACYVHTLAGEYNLIQSLCIEDCVATIEVALLTNEGLKQRDSSRAKVFVATGMGCSGSLYETVNVKPGRGTLKEKNSEQYVVELAGHNEDGKFDSVIEGLSPLQKNLEVAPMFSTFSESDDPPTSDFRSFPLYGSKYSIFGKNGFKYKPFVRCMISEKECCADPPCVTTTMPVRASSTQTPTDKITTTAATSTNQKFQNTIFGTNSLTKEKCKDLIEPDVQETIEAVKIELVDRLKIPRAQVLFGQSHICCADSGYSMAVHIELSQEQSQKAMSLASTWDGGIGVILEGNEEVEITSTVGNEEHQGNESTNNDSTPAIVATIVVVLAVVLAVVIGLYNNMPTPSFFIFIWKRNYKNICIYKYIYTYTYIYIWLIISTSGVRGDEDYCDDATYQKECKNKPLYQCKWTVWAGCDRITHWGSNGWL